MVQLGPLDLCVYRATNMLTSKTFKVGFCARKKDVEKCVWSLGDWLCQLDELTLVPEQRSFPSCGACTRRGILWHFYLSWFLGDFWFFGGFFLPLSVFEWQWKVREIRKLQRNLNPSVTWIHPLADVLETKWPLNLWWLRADHASGMERTALMPSPQEEFKRNIMSSSPICSILLVFLKLIRNYMLPWK